jgi:hypothetical protein
MQTWARTRRCYAALGREVFFPHSSLMASHHCCPSIDQSLITHPLSPSPATTTLLPTRPARPTPPPVPPCPHARVGMAARLGMSGQQGKEGRERTSRRRRFFSITIVPLTLPTHHHTQAQASGTITTTSSWQHHQACLSGRACIVAKGLVGRPPVMPAWPPLLPPHHSHPALSFPHPPPQSQPWCA